MAVKKKKAVKKKAEAKTGKEKDDKEKGKQLDLIDVTPEEAKPIVQAARLYKVYQSARLKALKKEVEQKQLILDLVKKSNMQRLKNGVIRFEHDGTRITVTPQDDKITVKEEKQ